MAKFRKKPVIIEAFQMTEERGHDNSEWPEWLNKAWQKELDEPGALWRAPFTDFDTVPLLRVTTLEGIMRIDWGDWIILGVEGEIYPCKPNIFEATYEEV